MTTVPADIVICAVAVVLTVGGIALDVVAHQILQCKAVMTSHEVDAGIGQSTTGFIEITRPGEAGCKLTDKPSPAFPIGANRIPIAPIPFRPFDREVTHLVTPLAESQGSAISLICDKTGS